MKKLSELTRKVREWNMMGYSLLPTLEIAIIHSTQYSAQVVDFLKHLGPMDLLYSEKSITESQLQAPRYQSNDAMLQFQAIPSEEQSNEQKKAESTKVQEQLAEQKSPIEQKSVLKMEHWDSRLKNSIYAIYLLQGEVEGRIHLVIDHQVEGVICDEDLRKSKKIVEKLKRNKNLIFVNCNPLIFNLESMSDHIEQFGLSFKAKQRQINFQSLLSHPKKSLESTPLSNKSFDFKKQSLKTEIVPQSLTTTNFFDHQSTQALCQLISKTYESVYTLDLNQNFQEMKHIYKQLSQHLKRYEGVSQLLKFEQQDKKESRLCIKSEQTKDKKLTAYALKCLHLCQQHLVSDLMGTFSSSLLSSQASFQNVDKNSVTLGFHYDRKSQSKMRSLSRNYQKRSLHWEVMEIMNELWDIERDSLLKEVDKMSLKYIEQRYKMQDISSIGFGSIGGFMPSSCFQAIFSPPLRATVNQILQTLQAIEMKILNSVQNTHEFYFDKTSIVDYITQKQLQSVQKVCETFRFDMKKTLNSQIEYISTSPEEFYSYKQLKSSLYTAEQQIYIEIKYIGKTYIRKVFDLIKETVPRLIGQNLLKQICYVLESQSVNNLIAILREHSPIEIEMSSKELRELEQYKINAQKIDKLIYYFSLKTNSITAIRNYHERSEKNWNRMFKAQRSLDQPAGQSYLKQTQQKGFLGWAKRLFANKSEQKLSKRSYSSEKSQSDQSKIDLNGQTSSESLQFRRREHGGLSQKNWLVIINTQRLVEQSKIQLCAKDGFPEKLRAAIWVYLAKRQRPENEKLQVNEILLRKDLLSEPQKEQLEEIERQIQKDVLRTPPPKLFNKQGFLKETLRNVLRAYSILDKQLRYTQGMNFFTGIIICVLIRHNQKSDFFDTANSLNNRSKHYYQDIEDKSLMILMYLMHQKGLRKVMLIERDTITDLCMRLEDYILKASPKMYDKIQDSGFNIEMIFSGALISGLTTSEVQFALQRRVLDMIVAVGHGCLYKIIGQFAAAAEGICENIEHQNLYFFLKDKVYDKVYEKIGDEGLSKLLHSI